jgi:hypothetical protein
MKKIFAVVVAIVALLIIVLAVATFAILLPWPMYRSELNYQNMQDAVQVNYSEMSFYMGNGSHEVNSTYTTVVLDMTRTGDMVRSNNVSNASNGVIAGPAGGNPIPGTGDLAINDAGKVIITLAGSSVPIVLPVTWVPGVSSPENTWILTTEHTVPVNVNQLPFDGIAISSSNSSLLNESLGSDMVVQSEIMLIEPGADYVANGTTKGYNNEIRQGQESWFESDVAGKQTVLKVDVRWKNPANKLRLMIYTPDGHVLGPYYDDADGQPDGRINIDIVNPDNVAPGEWHYKVNGIDVQGKDDYYVRTG